MMALGFALIGVGVLLLVLMGMAWFEDKLIPREPPLNGQTRVGIHQAHSRVTAAQTKSEIRATSARLRRQLDRQLRRGFGDSDD
jgi:hypothetical protein